MADHSGSTPFQQLSFESALQAYQGKTGITLAQHPIAVDLQSCHSVEDITTLLQGRAQAVSDFRRRDRMMNAIKTIVTLLTPLSDAAALTDAVRQKALKACLTFMTFFRHHSHLPKQCRPLSVYCWMHVPIFSSPIDIVVTFK
jgi:hypothetical protein